MAVVKQTENDNFTSFLKTLDSKAVDDMVHQLNETISALIDCTNCGNCCKTLMINVTDGEANTIAGYLHQTRKKFDEQYVEKGVNGMMIMNKMPCHFLNENKCTVYENRFSGCREFPAMHLPDFQERLFTTFMHYDRCPIIFNVVEQLKNQLAFSYHNAEVGT
ncbi:flagellin N-methylase [mine drainage metagenome]|uniref:Flagellin N-methylase n=1 Tax=mine drainage metagenome TaxID=410659 RepID=A0A1J5RNQ6_9ZZZZ